MDRVYPYHQDPSWWIVKAYRMLKKYEGIPDNEMAPLERGLAGKARNILRLWGNMNWRN